VELIAVCETKHSCTRARGFSRRSGQLSMLARADELDAAGPESMTVSVVSERHLFSIYYDTSLLST
jgi:hypothetical protein